MALTTVNGAVSQQRQYFPYGNKRGGADFAFEFNYTGQRLDDTGLLYYNARYYDPKLGQFISPDTIIPDPTDYFSYNRYLYSRGNPVKYNDPTGHYIETGLDVISLGMTINDIRVNGWNWGNGIGLVADIASLALPGIAGGGWIVKAITKVDDVGAAGASWRIIGNEISDPSSIRQMDNSACVLACGEMLSADRGFRIDQTQLGNVLRSESLRTNMVSADSLAAALNAMDPSSTRKWVAGTFSIEGAESIEVVKALSATGPWGAVVKGDNALHMVVVDGITEAGTVAIRDPWQGNKYNVEMPEFLEYWTQQGIFATP